MSKLYYQKNLDEEQIQQTHFVIGEVKMAKRIDVFINAVIIYNNGNRETYDALYKTHEGFHYGDIESRLAYITAWRKGIFSSNEVEIPIDCKSFKAKGFIPLTNFTKIESDGTEKIWDSKPTRQQLREEVHWAALMLQGYYPIPTGGII